VLQRMLELPRRISSALVRDAGTAVGHLVDLGAGGGPHLPQLLRALHRARGTWVHGFQPMLRRGRGAVAGVGGRAAVAGGGGVARRSGGWAAGGRRWWVGRRTWAGGGSAGQPSSPARRRSPPGAPTPSRAAPATCPGCSRGVAGSPPPPTSAAWATGSSATAA